MCSGDWCWGWVGGFTQLAESLITVIRCAHEYERSQTGGSVSIVPYSIVFMLVVAKIGGARDRENLVS